MSVASAQVVHALVGEKGHDLHRECCVVVVDLQVLQKEAAVYGEGGWWGVEVGREGWWQEQTVCAIRRAAS